MKTIVLKHPTLDKTFVQIADGDAQAWRDQGWKQSSHKAAAEAGLDLRPADEQPLDTTHAEAKAEPAAR